MKLSSLASTALVLGGLFASASATTAQCSTTTWPLTAGQTIDVGTVSVTNDGTNIYVTYTLNYQTTCGDGSVLDATFGTLHLWVGSNLENVPATGNGTPIPGQFPYQHDASGTTSYMFTVPFSAIGYEGVSMASQVCGMPAYVVPHAEVLIPQCDGSVDSETAFGGDQPVNVGTPGRWWFYGNYSICCDEGPPPTPFCQTAFAKGGWVWTTQKRSNPQNLPSLRLTMNRWGWAINLTAPGMTTYDIWAGAGLNNTANGTLVGQLMINWDGASVSYCYNLNAGFSMEELHFYAGDDSPTTIAPGQYGHTQYFDPATQMACDTLPLVDLNGGGVWLVAHAVVCSVATSSTSVVGG